MLQSILSALGTLRYYRKKNFLNLCNVFLSKKGSEQTYQFQYTGNAYYKCHCYHRVFGRHYLETDRMAYIEKGMMNF